MFLFESSVHLLLGLLERPHKGKEKCEMWGKAGGCERKEGRE